MTYSHEPSHWHSAESLPRQDDLRVGWLLGTRRHGLAAVIVAVIALGMVYHLVQGAAPHPPSIAEMVFALIGFLGASLGSAMICYGRELFDGKLSSSMPVCHVSRRHSGA